MMRSVCVAIAIANLALACCLQGEEAEQPPFEIAVRREDDRAETNVDRGKATIAIESPSGISSATVTRKGENWPEEVTLRLRLRGLERLIVKSGDLRIETAAGASDHDPTAAAPAPDSRVPTLDVRPLTAAGLPAKELPLPVGGLFEIGLPKALFEKNPKSIEIEWIDFFRG